MVEICFRSTHTANNICFQCLFQFLLLMSSNLRVLFWDQNRLFLRVGIKFKLFLGLLI